MTLEKDIELTFSEKIDPTKLSYREMLHWDRHNVFNYINFIAANKK